MNARIFKVSTAIFIIFGTIKHHDILSVPIIQQFVPISIYNFSMFCVYDSLYVFGFTALCWTAFNVFYALLSSYMMNKNDDDD